MSAWRSGHFHAESQLLALELWGVSAFAAAGAITNTAAPASLQMCLCLAFHCRTLRLLCLHGIPPYVHVPSLSLSPRCGFTACSGSLQTCPGRKLNFLGLHVGRRPWVGHPWSRVMLTSSSQEIRLTLSVFLQHLMHTVRSSVCSEIRESHFSPGEEPRNR